MKYPNLKEEKNLWRHGYKIVIGLDEAGRGPLAGPVVAGAVTINPKFETLNSKQIQSPNIKNYKRVLDFDQLDLFRISDCSLMRFFPRKSGFRILKVNDSKKLSFPQREKLYKALTQCPDIWWGVGIVSHKIIDKINIKNAAELAMVKAVKNLKNRLASKTHDRGFLTTVEKKIFLIVDGNRLDSYELKTMNYKLIVRGDQKVFSCAAASILAKVIRDRIMLKYHKKYPYYHFDRHKGYPTKLHYRFLRKYGICPIHRKSFRLVA